MSLRSFLFTLFNSYAFDFRDLKSALIFDGIAEALENDGANLVKKVKGIFGFKIKDGNGKEHLWIVDAKNGSGKVEFNGKGIFLKPYSYHHSPVKNLGKIHQGVLKCFVLKLNVSNLSTSNIKTTILAKRTITSIIL